MKSQLPFCNFWDFFIYFSPFRSLVFQPLCFPLVTSLKASWLRRSPYLTFFRSHSNKPGIDFPSSRYSLTEGLRNPCGITGTGISLSLRSSSILWSGSGPKAGAPGVLGFFARFDLIVCCCSDPSVKDRENHPFSIFPHKNHFFIFKNRWIFFSFLLFVFKLQN